MISVLCGSVAAGCTLITLAYGAEQIIKRAAKPPRKKRAARPGAEIISIHEYRSWKNAVNIYDSTTGKERNA